MTLSDIPVRQNLMRTHTAAQIAPNKFPATAQTQVINICCCSVASNCEYTQPWEIDKPKRLSALQEITSNSEALLCCITGFDHFLEMLRSWQTARWTNSRRQLCSGPAPQWQVFHLQKNVVFECLINQNLELKIRLLIFFLLINKLNSTPYIGFIWMLWKTSLCECYGSQSYDIQYPF